MARTNIPSLKRLIDAFGPEKGRELRNYYVARRDFGFQLGLSMADDILEGYGVEFIRHRNVCIWYVNMGDSYTTTLMKVNGKFRIGDWGSLIER